MSKSIKFSKQPTENSQWIAEAAYYKALARGFSAHKAQQDWFEAEQEYLHLLEKQPKNGLISLHPDFSSQPF